MNLPATQRRVICTLFDHHYLARGLCMIDSLRETGCDHEIWVLCLSDDCRRVMGSLAMPGVVLLTSADLERHIPALATARGNRSVVEYYFTSVPALQRYIFDHVPDTDCVMYIDADIKFFAGVNLVFDAIGNAPAALIPHNFQPEVRGERDKYGIYNAGWATFRATKEGLSLLDWWLARSLEWCHDRIEGDRYATQGYLGRFQQVEPGTVVLTQKGFNCAPWNIGGYAVGERNGRIFVDDDPLVFFHFHGLKPHHRFFFFDSHRDFRAPFPPLVRNRIYRPYVKQLVAREKQVAAMLPAAASRITQPRGDANTRAATNRRRWRTTLRRLLDIARGRPIFVFGRRAW